MNWDSEDLSGGTPVEDQTRVTLLDAHDNIARPDPDDFGINSTNIEYTKGTLDVEDGFTHVPETVVVSHEGETTVWSVDTNAYKEKTTVIGIRCNWAVEKIHTV